MTVLSSLSSRTFNPQTQDIPFTVAENATLIQVSFTHPDWPETGPVLQLDVQWGGVPGGVFTTSGGIVRDKAGNPTGGTMVTSLTVSKPPGQTSGSVRAQVLQTFTSAILVESF
jgi:hypothetical protein